MSDCAVSAGEPCQGCVLRDANGETLRAQAYDNPVPSLGRGRCNDYRPVTEYGVYWHDAGSARQLFLKVEDIV